MSTPAKPKPAVGYVRVSTLGQADAGVSLADQRERIAAYCVAHGYRLVGIEADEGLSAKRADNRPGLLAALRSVKRCRGVLVVTKLDRLARSTKDAIELAERIDRSGADLASITEQIDTATAQGRFIFRLFASLSELEREQVSERTRAALGHKRRQERRISRWAPYGYDFEAASDRLRPNEAEQPHLRAILAWHAEGRSYAAIAALLNERGVPAKKGGRWARCSVRFIVARHQKEEAARVAGGGSRYE